MAEQMTAVTVAVADGQDKPSVEEAMQQTHDWLIEHLPGKQVGGVEWRMMDALLPENDVRKLLTDLGGPYAQPDVIASYEKAVREIPNPELVVATLDYEGMT